MTTLNDEELSDVTGGTTVTGPFFTYTLRDKDSLSSVAMRFGTNVSVLMSINKLTSAKELESRKTLLIPQQ